MVRFWSDLWHPEERLIEITGEAGTQLQRLVTALVDGANHKDVSFVGNLMRKENTYTSHVHIHTSCGCRWWETCPDPDWDVTVSSLITRKYDRLTFILLRLVLQVTIYSIWRERNDRRHNSIAKSVDQLGRIIDKTMRNRIMATKYYAKPKLEGLMRRWFEAHLP